MSIAQDRDTDLPLAGAQSHPSPARSVPAVSLPSMLMGLVGVALFIAMALPVGRVLLGLYNTDPTLSHAPLVFILVTALFWLRRDAWKERRAGDKLGLLVLGVGAVLHVLSVWADTEFLKAGTLVMVAWGATWYLAGRSVAWATAGCFGLLLFVIPWPTTVVERIAFPLQMNSSAYAAMLAGIAGCPVVRSGVHLAVVPDPSQPPIYAIFVARQCSGLTSLLVLLTLGYLIAYHTPVKLGWRALMVAVVVPIAMLANAVRLTLILLAGANHGASFAKWVHDNEAPVLVFFCSMLLIGIRQGILAWTERGSRPSEEPGDDAASVAVAEAKVPEMEAEAGRPFRPESKPTAWVVSADAAQDRI